MGEGRKLLDKSMLYTYLLLIISIHRHDNINHIFEFQAEFLKKHVDNEKEARKYHKQRLQTTLWAIATAKSWADSSTSMSLKLR
jgi:hypothetical protein